MKSTTEELQKRGMASSEDIEILNGLMLDQLIECLHSKTSTTRTAAAMQLTKSVDIAADELLSQLVVEKSLYTKIAICETLEKGNSSTAEKMINYLGRIGNNQHKKLPGKISAKKSYPLPRDIIARTLGKMDSSIIPILMQTLQGDDKIKIRELLDAIGFMVFYNPCLVTEENVEIIYQTIKRHESDEIIFWKSILCLSAFPMEKSKILLEEFAQKPGLLGDEAKRSLKLISSSIIF